MSRIAALSGLVLLLAPGGALAQFEFGAIDPNPYYYDATHRPEGRADLDFAEIIEQAKYRSPAERALIFGAPTVEVRRNFVYVEDTDRTLTIPWQTNQDLNRSFQFATEALYSVLPDEFDMIILYTSFQTGVGAFFYQPLANDIWGIGAPPFDNTGSSPLEGFIFMNYWRSFEGQWGQYGDPVVQGFMRHTFNQEMSHRWLVYLGGTPSMDRLLGRDDAHWNYFMHSNASPMEGNNWRDNMDGTFTTLTTYENWRFNDLDLYLMGLMAPADVRPWFVITNPNTSSARDIYNQRPTVSSPPQILQPQRIPGTRVDYTVDDVTAAVGGRSPSYPEAKNAWRVAFVLLSPQGGFTDSHKREFETMVDDSALGFRQATRDRGRLDFILADIPKQPLGGTCIDATDCDPQAAPICATPNQGGQKFCSIGCSTASDCPSDWCCVTDGQSGGFTCHPTDLCPPPDPADAGGGESDGGMSSGPDGSTVDPNPGVCACDQTTVCDANGETYCACDPECACACDLTTSCDEGCACDPDPGCAGSPIPPKDEGGCRHVQTQGGASGVLGLFLAGLVLLGLRRRRLD
jgi:MYXO-CTERM domain-containing protein